MKTLILAAAVAAFELAFLASLATPPAGAVPTLQARDAGPQALARGAQPPVPCTPRG
jgi:hypothetical protein